MKLIKLTERLFIYLSMLETYKGVLNGTLSSRDSITFRGFCLHLNDQYKIDVYEDEIFVTTLPELFVQRPKKATEYDFWFPKGSILPRITCIEAAIKLTEEKIALED